MLTSKDDSEALYDRYLKEHDEDALRVLLERFREKLTLFIYGYIHDMDEAEDLMVDCFAEVAVGKSIFRRKSSFSTWLFSIGHNKARFYLRSKKFQLTEDGEVIDTAAPPGEGPEAQLLDSERNKELYRAMTGLKDEYREILHLMYFEDMTYEEIAGVIGKTRKQTYRMMEHAREALKSALSGSSVGSIQGAAGQLTRSRS